MLYNKYSVLIQTKLSIINSLNNIKEEARKSLLDEVTPIIEYLTNTFSLVDKNKVRAEREQQQKREAIQEQAIVDLMKSDNEGTGTLNDILVKLQERINSMKSS